MNPTYEERQELETVSKQVFGKANWYKRLVSKGVRKSINEIEADPTGSHYKYFTTTESILKYMHQVSANTKVLLEKMKVEATKNDLSK